MSFKIIVDSCCDLSSEVLSTGVYQSIPLTIHVGENEFRDDETLRTEELVDAMAMCQEASHTACPAPAEYLAAYEAAEGDVYVVTLSALLSGSHNSAWQAAQIFREEHPERNIHVFNSCSASAGETKIALALAELAGSGLPFEEVVAQMNQRIAGMNTLFVLENLDNLRKNGRLTRMQSLITGALRVKLLCGATPEGEIQKFGQGLTIRQTLAKMVNHMAEDPDHVERRLVIAHCNCLERAELVREMVRQKCRFGEILIVATGGISTVYANDGGIVAAY